MRNMICKMEPVILNTKSKLLAKKEGSNQLVVMFIIIAVTAGAAGLLYLGLMSIPWTHKVELFYAAFVNSSSFSCGVRINFVDY